MNKNSYDKKYNVDELTEETEIKHINQITRKSMKVFWVMEGISLVVLVCFMTLLYLWPVASFTYIWALIANYLALLQLLINYVRINKFRKIALGKNYS